MVIHYCILIKSWEGLASLPSLRREISVAPVYCLRVIIMVHRIDTLLYSNQKLGGACQFT